MTSFPDSKQKRQISQGGGSEPRLSDSRRELFFKSGGSSVVVDIPDGQTLAPSVPRALFSVRRIGVHRTGQQDHVVPNGRTGPQIRPLNGGALQTMVYAENWFEELKRKVANP